MYDKSLLEPCPVLYPTAEEFTDPIGYLSSPAISRLGAQSGLVKIVPPTDWRPPFSISQSFSFHTRLQKLSDLGLTTRSRKFFRDNVNRFLKMRRKRQLKLSFRARNSATKSKVDIYYYDLYLAVEKLGGHDAMTEEKWGAVNKTFGIDDPNSITIRDEYDHSIKSYAVYLSHNNQNYEFPESDDDDEYDNCLICGKHDHPSKTLLCDNCDNPYHMTCLANPLSAIPSGTWYCDKCLIGTGEYGFEEQLNIKYDLPEFYRMCEQFDKEFVEEYNGGKALDTDTIEKKFWEFIDVQKSDLEVKYGADIHNLKPGEISGFPMPNTPGIRTDDFETKKYIDHPFNLTKLPFAKGSLLNYINTSISGMTVPWIYIGTLLSTFCWHVEDHYTLSANYCHFGATKKWYGIPSSQADQFEALMKDTAPDLFQKQPDLLHQLVTLISPMKLVENGIKCVYADQNPNEFVVTFPRVYHSGFNCGFNFNEAVNFTMNGWLEFGAQSIDDYKKIKKENVFNHYQLIENIMREFNARVEKRDKLSSSEIDLVERCAQSFEKFTEKQTRLIENIGDLKYHIEYKPKQFKPRIFEDEQNGHFEAGSTEEEEDLCDACKTHISYQYCIINNKSHTFGVAKKEITSDVLTPKLESTQGFGTRIPVHQLLTPNASPYEETKPELKVELNDITESEAARRLSELHEQEQQKLSAEAEYSRLINEAKRAAAESDEQSKRRKSRRIQHIEEEKTTQLFAPTSAPRNSKMSLVQAKSSLKSLNEKEKIRVCLECLAEHCGKSGDRAPRGSVLLYETYPSELRSLISTTRTNIVQAAQV